jgi:hypothetical protein
MDIDDLKNLGSQKQLPRRVVENVRSRRIIRCQREEVVHPLQHVHRLRRQLSSTLQPWLRDMHGTHVPMRGEPREATALLAQLGNNRHGR